MRLQVVVGGQYGSEAKGHVTARLARQAPQPTVVRVAGPNAGHSAVDEGGVKWALRQVPVGCVQPRAQLVIAPGSEIDPAVLLSELDQLDDAGLDASARLIIDPEATILEARHKHTEHAEGLVDRVGSTGKGIGAARADRLLRRADRLADDTALVDFLTKRGVHVEPTLGLLLDSQDVIIEGTQGYGLGLHAGHYPQCTSSDTRAIDFLAMAGISPWAPQVDYLRVWVVLRPYPIRVAGNSGPLHDETTWADLDLPEERTTVTNKVRRVGHWDPILARNAVLANGGPSDAVRVALTMVDQVVPDAYGWTNEEYWDTTGDQHQVIKDYVDQWVAIVRQDTGAPVRMLTTSDRTGVDL